MTIDEFIKALGDGITKIDHIDRVVTVNTNGIITIVREFPEKVDPCVDRDAIRAGLIGTIDNYAIRSSFS